MRHGLLVAFLALAGAACDDGQALKSEAGAEPDAEVVDAMVAVDVARADAQQSPDGAAADAGADGGELAVDGGTADAGADLAADAGADAGADVGGDLAADAGVLTCGPGASREMLCTSYCDGIGRFCSAGNMQYPSADACKAACNAPTWACGKAGDTTGNSLFCRLAHMTLAGVGSAAKECPNAGPHSPVCL